MDFKPVSRRSFTRRTAILSGSTLLPSATPANADPVAPQTEESSPAPSISETDLRFANILRQYGHRLTPEQTDRIRRILAENERMLAAIRRFPLENGDAPASVLKIGS